MNLTLKYYNKMQYDKWGDCTKYFYESDRTQTMDTWERPERVRFTGRRTNEERREVASDSERRASLASSAASTMSVLSAELSSWQTKRSRHLLNWVSVKKTKNLVISEVKKNMLSAEKMQKVGKVSTQKRLENTDAGSLTASIFLPQWTSTEAKLVTWPITSQPSFTWCPHASVSTEMITVKLKVLPF